MQTDSLTPRDLYDNVDFYRNMRMNLDSDGGGNVWRYKHARNIHSHPVEYGRPKVSKRNRRWPAIPTLRYQTGHCPTIGLRAGGTELRRLNGTMAGILVRLVLSIGCIAGVLMSHTMAVLFDRSVTLLEKAVLEHSYTSGQKRWLGVRIYGWRFLYHLAVALMVAFIIMATILFIMFCWALFQRIGAI